MTAGTRSMLAQQNKEVMKEEDKLPERPDTPCVAVCSTTFDEICRGCGRSVVEVAHWVSMAPADKELVWKRILSQGYPRRNK